MNPADKFLKRCKAEEGRTLIVGSKIHPGTEKTDRRSFYADAVGIDIQDGEGVDLVLDLEQPLPSGLGHFDHIECTSVLEHSRRPWSMAANLARLMRTGASIYVTVPWVWRYHAYDHDYFRVSKDGLAALFESIEWQRLQYISHRALDGDKVDAISVNGHPYLARTETFGFGNKR